MGISKTKSNASADIDHFTPSSGTRVMVTTPNLLCHACGTKSEHTRFKATLCDEIKVYDDGRAHRKALLDEVKKCHYCGKTFTEVWLTRQDAPYVLDEIDLDALLQL
jgi:hypothetical protein